MGGREEGELLALEKGDPDEERLSVMRCSLLMRSLKLAMLRESVYAG